MDIQYSNQQNSFDERKMVFQNEDISYDEAYLLNNSQLLTNQQLINIVSSVLTEIVQETDKYKSDIATSFHGKTIPNISIKDYIARISKCSHCSQECIIFALIYIDRITERHQNFILNSFNIHRLLITSIMLAAKFFDDRYYNNDYYSKVGGISNLEINLLEREFLHYINFRLYISPVLFFKYRQRLLLANQSELENNQ